MGHLKETEMLQCVTFQKVPDNNSFNFTFTQWEIRNSQTFQQQWYSYHDLDIDVRAA